MASFSNDGRTLTVAAARSRAFRKRNLLRRVETSAPAATTNAPSAGATVRLPPHFYAVVDASHGGDDRGALLSTQLAEKDVCLALARRLRQELESRGISTLVLRDPDTISHWISAPC